MDKGQMHINDYAMLLLTDHEFCKREYQKYNSSAVSIQNVYGKISTEILKKVIKKAKWNGKVRVLLGDILFYGDHSSISDENFRLLLHFPGQARKTYLSNLGHLHLSFYQMQILNRYPLNFEAFAWLFDHICQYDFFTEADMLQILKDNADVSNYGIQTCIQQAQKEWGPSAKLEAAKLWVEKKIAKE